MRVWLLAALLALPGCSLFHAAFGFKLTDHAIYCGQALGIAVWVDGVDTEALPQMKCEQALGTVVVVRDEGAKVGLWEVDRQFPGYQLEFINTTTLNVLDSIGSDHAIGYTLTLSHRIAIGYAYDKDEGKDPPGTIHSSGIELMHELLHAKEDGNIAHCHWASKYAPAFKGFKHQWMSNFDDVCENQGCSGAMCWSHGWEAHVKEAKE